MKMKATGYVRTTIAVPAELSDRVRALAEEEMRTVSNMIALMIRDYLARKDGAEQASCDGDTLPSGSDRGAFRDDKVANLT